jgi:hypothetical protein
MREPWPFGIKGNFTGCVGKLGYGERLARAEGFRGDTSRNCARRFRVYAERDFGAASAAVPQ